MYKKGGGTGFQSLFADTASAGAAILETASGNETTPATIPCRLCALWPGQIPAFHDSGCSAAE